MKTKTLNTDCVKDSLILAAGAISTKADRSTVESFAKIAMIAIAGMIEAITANKHTGAIIDSIKYEAARLN